MCALPSCSLLSSSLCKTDKNVQYLLYDSRPKSAVPSVSQSVSHLVGQSVKAEVGQDKILMTPSGQAYFDRV